MVRARYDSTDPEADLVTRISRGIFYRLERGARPRRQLLLHERRDQFHSDTWAIPRSASNNSKFLPEPRIGAAWSPFGNKTVIRAGFGMYNDLQDALGYRMDQNAPFNPTFAISSLPVANFPDRFHLCRANAKLAPGGVQPDLKLPTLISYSLRVRAGVDAEHFAHGRLHRFARLS